MHGKLQTNCDVIDWNIFGRTLNTGYIYIAYILFAFLGYLLRFKPIKKILAVFAILIVAAWIYHEINSIVQEYAKKLNTESHQIVDDTYKRDRCDKGKQTERNEDRHTIRIIVLTTIN